ncbi:E3 ubiquitin-protein ligase SHPRH-like, partial [Stegodyphus dumicola]|uniref:E3 ubiquitin-protein ligase SHPRH-like n=1 Tax=Stegodyphus dumicola TaxID=202533 RepID=UPI0015AE8FAD
IMLPLKNLQRACCHHQLVRDTFVDVQKSNISMSALLNHLLQKSLYECEEAHRAALCAMNGLAGIYSLREDYESACKMYKKILASIEEYSANVRTDPLQHIHVLYNFSNLILSLEKEVVANTPGLLEILQNVDCEEMKSKYNLLCENYVRRHREGLRNYWDHNSHVRCDVEVTFPLFKNEKKGFTESSWWYEIFQRLTEKDRQTFIEKVKDMLIDDAQNVHVKELPSVAHRFSEVSGFIVTLLRLSEELYRTRTEASNIVYLCVNKMNPDYVNIAKNCHLRPLGGVKKKCLLCQADTVLKQYESKLYRVEEASSSRSRRSETIAELESSVSFKTLRQGNHADSEFELILKFFMSYCRPFKEAKHRIEDGVKELKLLEAMKKEFKVLQTAWIKASEYMAAIDELEMAKMSMKTLQQTEPMAKSPVSKLIPTGMGNDNDEMQFKSDVSIFENILRKKLGQLYYLQNLKRAEGHEVHPFDQTCPVCVTKLTDTWCVLHCGHCFCLPCVQMVGKYAEAHAKDLSCPVCRSLTPRSEIYSVDRQAVKDDDETEIKGRYSSKIHGVLKCLLEIRKKNSKAKTIVFSSWKDFLFLLEMALRENNIKCVSLCNRTPNTFENYLPRFKSSLEENVLLLPLKVGANGMNITEATNVIIIEPVLDYSQIRQAIGRVYRMGQTERTFVYMFYVADTVEESIFNMNSSFCVENEMLETVNDLKKLFE